MPSFLIPQGNDFFDKWVADAAAINRVARIAARSPWQGITPDLDPYQSGPSAMSADSFGLVAKPGPGGVGEVLMADAGFTAIDVANLPLTTSTGSHTNITMLAEFNRTTAGGAKTAGTEYAGPTMLALVGGDDSTAGAAELWRLKATAGTWEKVTYEASTGSPNAAKNPAAGREFLSDWAEFPAGAPNRDAYSGNIDEPVFVWCNLSDNVMVWPNDKTSPADASFEPLASASDFSDVFKAATVEHFGGRLYFGNTIEGTTQHRQRIRRTSLFTANLDPTKPGAGAFDIRDFSGDLLRLEKLGDLMVAYFEDGVAFIRLSGIATSPDAVQLLREKRGLIGTHAVTSVGNQDHFGIFDDGWFFLDPSGRWTEVGMMEIDGVRTSKWKDYFYDNLDKDFRHRVVVSYDGRFIRIAWTKVSGSDNQEVWIFDPRGNRVFRDTYPVTVWGINNLVVQAATKWNDSQFGTWESEQGTWESFAAKFGLKALTHASTTGHVMVHNYDKFTQFNTMTSTDEAPDFRLEGTLNSGGDPTTLKTAIKLWLEYIHQGETAVTFIISGDSSDGAISQSITIGEQGVPGDVETAFATFNFSATNLKYSISGTSPIQIRSVLADIRVGQTEESLGG